MTVAAAGAGQGRAGRPSAGQRARRRSRIPLLVSLAVLASAVVMGALSAQALSHRRSCGRRPADLHVAASPDIAPAITRVATAFTRQRHQLEGRCISVTVTPISSATAAAAIDGQAHAGGPVPAFDAWIPDSSIWLDVVRGYPLGAQRVQPTGISVARSPLMIVMPATVAERTPAFNDTTGWSFLLPASIGGPASSLRLRVDMPDPTTSAAGLSAMVEMSRLLGSGAAARAALTKFVFSIEPTPQFDSPASLASFVALAQPPLGGHPVTVTSEQAVIQYDRVTSGPPLAARYPAAMNDALGSPELDYPYLLATSDPVTLQVARQFGQALAQPYAAKVVRYFGFRSASGVPDRIPARDGLASQPLQLASAVAPSEAEAVLQAWQKLGLGSRDLVLDDVSSAMAQPAGHTGLTLEQELSRTAALGLALFPDNTEMGVWKYASNLADGRPYQQMVPIGPLTAEIGLVSRRQLIQQQTSVLQPVTNAPAAMNDTILAAYRHVLATYQQGFQNAVVVLTSGADNAPGDLPASALIARLRTLYNPSRRVEIVIIVFGRSPEFATLQQIAGTTGGAAFEITSPRQIGRVFFAAIARRICPSNCPAP
jgi:Ca-activated chloride channel family protein